MADEKTITLELAPAMAVRLLEILDAARSQEADEMRRQAAEMLANDLGRKLNET